MEDRIGADERTPGMTRDRDRDQACEDLIVVVRDKLTEGLPDHGAHTTPGLKIRGVAHVSLAA